MTQLFLESWRCDPYGSRWMQLSTKLKSSAFGEAKKQLANQGLFVFKRETSIQDSRSTVCWMVRNLHGSRVKDFWKVVTPTDLDATDTIIALKDTVITTAHVELDATDTVSTSTQNQSASGLQDASISSHYHIYDQQYFNSAEDGVVVVDKKIDEEELQPSTEEIKEVLTTLRSMGMKINPTLQVLVNKHYANAKSAIAYIKERINRGEQFRNLEGAFVKALKAGAKPEHSNKSRVSFNPPTIDQMATLQTALDSRAIVGFDAAPYDDNSEAILVDTGKSAVWWWEYLNS